MRQLTSENLKILEVELKNYFPQSLQVYGIIFQLNRNGQRADPVSVLVDQWPEFSILLIKPEFRERGDLFKDLTVFSKTDANLRDLLLAQTDVIDWKKFICLAAEFHHEKLLEAVAVNRGAPVKKEAVCHALVLRDPSKLSAVESSLKISSLNESHLALVNSSWKFGCEDSKVMIKNMILNFPSCCVLDSDDQPVAWILTYATCALGMLYTVPEHRGKGYAKALVTIMSKRHHAQGYPVYCFIEEENKVSYTLFKSLGFTEEMNYRAAWFVFNDL